MDTVPLQYNYMHQDRTDDSEEKKTRPSRIIVPVIIIASAVVLLAIAAVVIIPKLSGRGTTESVKAEETSIEETGTVRDEITADSITTAAESAANTATAATAASTAASIAETTTVPETARKEYSIGEIIKFGHYEQNGVMDDGTEEVEWIVLDVQDDRVLVISRYGLDSQQYDSTGAKKVTWEQCTLRQWLNGYFINSAFSVDEQAKILDSYVTADGNPQHPDRGAGNDTWDKIFLLSTSEAERYFDSDASRKMQPTSYALAQGVKYCNNKDNQGYGYWWWLRTPGRDEDYAALVYPEGQVDYTGYHFNDTENAVRPAMWISR